jgi:hypothetical protein
MTDVTTITELKELEEIKTDLNFFINKKIVAEMYAEDGKEPIQLDLDREAARKLLVEVVKQLSLINRLARKSDSPSRLQEP